MRAWLKQLRESRFARLWWVAWAAVCVAVVGGLYRGAKADVPEECGCIVTTTFLDPVTDVLEVIFECPSVLCAYWWDNTSGWWTNCPGGGGGTGQPSLCMAAHLTVNAGCQECTRAIMHLCPGFWEDNCAESCPTPNDGGGACSNWDDVNCECDDCQAVTCLRGDNKCRCTCTTAQRDAVLPCPTGQTWSNEECACVNNCSMGLVWSEACQMCHPPCGEGYTWSTTQCDCVEGSAGCESGEVWDEECEVCHLPCGEGFEWSTDDCACVSEGGFGGTQCGRMTTHGQCLAAYGDTDNDGVCDPCDADPETPYPPETEWLSHQRGTCVFACVEDGDGDCCCGDDDSTTKDVDDGDAEVCSDEPCPPEPPEHCEDWNAAECRCEQCNAPEEVIEACERWSRVTCRCLDCDDEDGDGCCADEDCDDNDPDVGCPVRAGGEYDKSRECCGCPIDLLKRYEQLKDKLERRWPNFWQDHGTEIVEFTLEIPFFGDEVTARFTLDPNGWWFAEELALPLVEWVRLFFLLYVVLGLLLSVLDDVWRF